MAKYKRDRRGSIPREITMNPKERLKSIEEQAAILQVMEEPADKVRISLSVSPRNSEFMVSMDDIYLTCNYPEHFAFQESIQKCPEQICQDIYNLELINTIQKS